MGQALQWLIDKLLDALQVIADLIVDLYEAWLLWLVGVIQFCLGIIEDIVAFLWEKLHVAYAKILGWFKDAIEDAWQEFYKIVEPWAEAIYLWLSVQMGEIRDAFIQHAKDNGYWAHITDLKDSAGALANAYADAAWLLPLNQCLVIFAAAVVVVGTIRLARWILSFAWITG